jgi:hypothetical protein
MRTDVVGDAEGPDDELARTHRLDRAADLFDDAAILVAHSHRRFDIVQAAEGPEIGAADPGGRQSDDGVGRLLDFWLGDLFAPNVPRAIKNGC